MTVGDMQLKKIFVVLGMARTGTSAISRALKVFGVNLGNALTNSQAEWNPTGFWEDSDIVYGINGKIFSRLEFAPYGILTIPPANLTAQHIPDIHAEAAAVLSKRLEQTNAFGFKDPSTIKVLPFWRDVFSAMQVQHYYLIALRNPLAAARSYQKRTGCELEIGLLLWCAHLLQAVEESRDTKRLVVSYDLLLQDPRRQLDRIAAAFHLGDVDEREAQIYLQEFLDKKLNRFQASHDEFSTHPAVRAVKLCKDLYECLLKVAQDEWSFDSRAFAARWQEIECEYQQSYPMHCYLDRLLKKRKTLRRNMRDTHKSYLWKLLSPFTRLDSYADDAFFAEWQAVKNELDESHPLCQFAGAVLKENQKIACEMRQIHQSLPWRLVRPLWWLDHYLRTRRQRGRLHKRLIKAYG